MNNSYPPFEYGSAVRWWWSGAPLLHGSICGFSVVETSERAAGIDVPLGTVLALVEKGSGGTAEVPLDQLELIM